METTGYLLRLNYLLMTFTESLPPLFESVPLICLCVCVCVCVYIYIQLIYLFMAALGLCCCMLSLVATKRGYSPGAVRGLLTAVASAVVEHGSRTCGLSSYGTWAECSIACGIFLDQGSNSHFLHWQVDSLPLSHQGSPGLFISLAFQ